MLRAVVAKPDTFVIQNLLLSHDSTAKLNNTRDRKSAPYLGYTGATIQSEGYWVWSVITNAMNDVCDGYTVYQLTNL